MEPERRTVHKVRSSRSEINPCYRVIYGERERATTQTSLDCFSRGWIDLNPSRNQDLCHQSQAWVRLQLTLWLQLLTILQLYYLTLSVPDLTVGFIIRPLLYHHDMPWNGFDLRPVNDTQSYLTEDCGVWKFPSTDERHCTEFVKSLKLGIYCFHNMKFIAYLKCLIFQVCKFIKWF